MANPIIRIKRGSSAPASGVLSSGELAMDLVGKSLYIGQENGTALPIAGEGTFATKVYTDAAATAVQLNLTDEVNRATTAEVALGSRIDNVLSNVDGAALDSLTEIVAAFQAADSTINGAITSLATGATADIDAEEARALAAEGVLDSKIDQEILDRVADVDAEEARALAAEAVNAGLISAEATRAIGIESGLDVRVTALETTIDGGAY